MSQDEPHKGPKQQSFQDAPAVSDPLSVLLADDDDELRKLLAWSLRQEGYEVIECPDGISLLNHLDAFLMAENSRDFDLIISDIRMPGITGLEILEGVSGMKGCPPVILITAFGDEETHAQAHRLGVEAIFDKPFDIETLLARVHEIKCFGPSVANRRFFPWKNKTHPLGFPLDIVFRHLSHSPQVEAFVRRKAAKLNRFSSKISDCRVVIDVPHHHHKHGNLYQVHVTLSVLNQELVVDHDPEQSETHKDLNVAISDALSAACHQVKVFLDKHKGHKDQAGGG